jgi:hypothetical protein
MLFPALVIALLPAQPDLSKLDLSIRKEPAYASRRPLYGLAVFGLKAARVWMVLDQTDPKGKYDVLHIDRDADGDLTGPGERVTLGAENRFRLGDWVDPTGAKHTDFNIRLSGEPPTVMLGLGWRGKFRFGGGYPEEAEAGYLRFAATPADAPVLVMNGDGPFRFQRWYGGKLPIGGSDDFKVFLGQPGRGASTFCAAQEHFLPQGEFVRATLIYRDGMGKEQRSVCELKERC